MATQTRGTKARQAPRTRRERVDATRSALLRAAAETFNSVGYFATDSNRLAHAAGYAPAMFYQHFHDKQEIFLQAYAGWVAAEWQAIDRTLARGGPPATTAARLARLIVAHHRRWRRFRASLRALAAIETAVHAFQVEQRRLQMAWIASLRARAGHRPRSAAEGLVLLLTIERLCDAIADGDGPALGVANRALEGAVADVLQAFLANPG